MQQSLGRLMMALVTIALSRQDSAGMQMMLVQSGGRLGCFCNLAHVHHKTMNQRISCPLKRVDSPQDIYLEYLDILHAEGNEWVLQIKRPIF